MLATSKVKMSGSEEKSEQEHKQQNFFVRICYIKRVRSFTLFSCNGKEMS